MRRDAAAPLQTSRRSSSVPVGLIAVIGRTEGASRSDDDSQTAAAQSRRASSSTALVQDRRQALSSQRGPRSCPGQLGTRCRLHPRHGQRRAGAMRVVGNFEFSERLVVSDRAHFLHPSPRRLRPFQRHRGIRHRQSVRPAPGDAGPGTVLVQTGGRPKRTAQIRRSCPARIFSSTPSRSALRRSISITALGPFPATAPRHGTAPSRRDHRTRHPAVSRNR